MAKKSKFGTSEQARTVAPSEMPRYHTIEQFSKMTTLSISTIQRLVKTGRLKPFQPGGPRHRMLFAADALEQLASAPSGSIPDSVPVDKSNPPRRGPRLRWEQDF